MVLITSYINRAYVTIRGDCTTHIIIMVKCLLALLQYYRSGSLLHHFAAVILYQAFAALVHSVALSYKSTQCTHNQWCSKL